MQMMIEMLRCSFLFFSLSQITTNVNNIFTLIFGYRSKLKMEDMIIQKGIIYPRNRATLIIVTPMRTPTSPPTTLGSIFAVIECKTNIQIQPQG